MLKATKDTLKLGRDCSRERHRITNQVHFLNKVSVEESNNEKLCTVVD